MTTPASWYFSCSLAAAGWGWGGRMKFSVMNGCLPVIVQVCAGYLVVDWAWMCLRSFPPSSLHPASLFEQDGIRVEWEEQLPLQKYALRIPMWLLNRLPEILEL